MGIMSLLPQLSLLILACSAKLGLPLRFAAIEQKEQFPEGYHDLRQVAQTLQNRNHHVEILHAAEHFPEWQDYLTGEDDRPAKYHAVLVSGRTSAEVADFAARLGIVVVRFFPDSKHSADSPFSVLRERPDVLVFANQKDAEQFPYMEGVPRLQLPPKEVESSYAEAYGQMEAALEEKLLALGKQLVAEYDERAGECPADLEHECTEAHFKPLRPSARAGEKPLLGLVMIVKNENATIAATLESIKDDIDYWTIVDTGSSDGTQDTVEATMEGIPGQLLSEPFVDFSTTRNFALRAHGERTAYALMIDADFAVEGAWRLRQGVHRLVEECRERSVVDCPKGIKIWVKLGEMGFFSNRVFPTPGMGTEEGWKYTYPVHEVPGWPALDYMNVGIIDDVLQHPHIIMQGLPITHTKSSQRWRNLDLPLLIKERELKPDDTRVAFYLGQTFDLIDEREKALKVYQERIDMGGWQQEIFEAHLRRAKILIKNLKENTSLDPLNDTSIDPTADLNAALDLYPMRAEPLMLLSLHSEWLRDHWCHRDHDPPVCKLQQQVVAFDYARLAAEEPVPGGDTLFADLAVYEYQAREQVAITGWYVAKDFADAFDTGMKAAQMLHQKYPADEQKRANLEWYEKLKSGLTS